MLIQGGKAPVVKLIVEVFIKQHGIFKWLKPTDLFNNLLQMKHFNASLCSKIGLRREFTGGQLGCCQVLWESKHSSIKLRPCKKPKHI